MSTRRRIATAVLTAALSLGVVGAVAGPAEARTDISRSDTTWPW
jgi:hypothetical protein